MSYLENYFFLLDDIALVKGAKYSLLVDLSKGSSNRPNETAIQIIEMGEQGFRISEVLDELKSKIDVHTILSFIEYLHNQGMICISTNPKKEKPISYNPSLQFLWMEVTSACNQRCVHCYADNDSIETKGLPFLKLKRIIDEAANIGCKAIQFTGGECTLRNDLMSLVKHARSKDFAFIEVFTNGTLLNESMVKFLAEERTRVAISIHGCTAQTHDGITGLPGSFEKTMRNLKMLIDYRIPIRCNTIALKQNEHELNEIGLILNELGVKDHICDLVRPCGRGMSVDNWPDIFSLRSIQSKPCFEITRENYSRNKRGNSCWFGKAAITYSGDVIPCPFARSQIVGNVVEQDFAEIISGEGMQSLWNLNNDRIEVCKDCEYRYLCTDCRPWAYGFTGNIFSKYPRCTYDPYAGNWMTPNEA
jgi:radical SAM protein with 4Fe4S-binding SPASM domain